MVPQSNPLILTLPQRRFAVVMLPNVTPSRWLLACWAVCVASCSAELRPPEPPVPPQEENLLAPLLEDGIPAELNRFADPPEGYLIERVDGGHQGEVSLTIIGDGKYGGVNVGRVQLEGRVTYVASAYVDCTAGQSLLKLDYYQGDKLLGTTSSLPARYNGWQQISVLSQRSLYPRATHVMVVAVCRGDVQTRFDDFALITYSSR
jgi:hypothetical protein